MEKPETKTPGTPSASPQEPTGFLDLRATFAGIGRAKATPKFGGRRLVFSQLLRVLVCSGTGPESPTGNPDLLIQAALAAQSHPLVRIHPSTADVSCCFSSEFLFHK